MSDYDEALKGIKEIAAQLQSLQDRAYDLYSNAVESIVNGQTTSKEDIDLHDGLRRR